jgi:hypothetical protein
VAPRPCHRRPYLSLAPWNAVEVLNLDPPKGQRSGEERVRLGEGRLFAQIEERYLALVAQGLAY